MAILDENKLGIRDMDSKMIRKCCKDLLGHELEITDEQIEGVLEPFNNIQGKITIGGPSTASVTQMIQNLTAKVAEQKEWLQGAEDHVTKAYAKLAEEEKKIVG